MISCLAETCLGAGGDRYVYIAPKYLVVIGTLDSQGLGSFPNFVRCNVSPNLGSTSLPKSELHVKQRRLCRHEAASTWVGA